MNKISKTVKQKKDVPKIQSRENIAELTKDFLQSGGKIEQVQRGTTGYQSKSGFKTSTCYQGTDATFCLTSRKEMPN